MGDCDNMANIKLTFREIQRKLVEGCECEAKSSKSETPGLSPMECLLLGLGAMLVGALLGIQGFAFYKRAVSDHTFILHTSMPLPQTRPPSSHSIAKEKEEEAEGDLGNSRTFVLEDYSLREARVEESSSEGMGSPQTKVLGSCNAWLWK